MEYNHSHRNTTCGPRTLRSLLQDDIKLRPNLTVNLGVRSETHGGSSEKYNNAGGFDPTIPDPVAQ